METIVNKIIQSIVRSFSAILISTLVFTSLAGAQAETNTKTDSKVAIIPFETHAKDDISYIARGILKMLDSRLTLKNKVSLVPKNKIAQLKPITPATTQSILDLGKKTKADYVITGVITEFSGASSIDVKVYQLKDQSFLTFYGQAETMDAVITQTDIIAAKINKKVFNRTTRSYEKFEKEKKISEEELRRMNPERMLPAIPNRENGDKPWWKIW